MKRYGWLLGLIFVFALVLPLLVGEFWIHVGVEILILGLFAVSFNMIFGYMGQLSFGHAAYYGVGAYVTGMLMVKAGKPVGQTIEQLAPLLYEGDIIIDGGNSYYKDTEERVIKLQSQGILYLGTGISGGEEGARFGPSIMPGGVKEGWPHVKSIFQAIAAKVGPDKDIPCCE